MANAKLKWQSFIPPKKGEIECQFNPASLTISKSVDWDGEKSPSFNAPFLLFAGGNSAKYSLSLFFDTYSHPDTEDVRFYTNQLLQLTLRGAGYSMYLVPWAQPPLVTFEWGSIKLFSAVVESVQITYTLFNPDGTPIRAKADVDFVQNELLGDDIIPAQNPTSRTDSRRTRIVNSQTRLDQVAFEEYRDASFWRVLAEANNLDNPFELRDGQLLVIPQEF